MNNILHPITGSRSARKSDPEVFMKIKKDTLSKGESSASTGK